MPPEKKRLKTGAKKVQTATTRSTRRVFRPIDLQLRSAHAAAFAVSPIRRFAPSPIRLLATDLVHYTLAGLSAFPWQALLGAILPLLIGILLGNLDPDCRSFFGKVTGPLIPFFAFALGSTLDLHRVAQAGLLGVFLGLLVVAVTGAALFAADRLTGGTGVAGLAAASTAGNAAAVPAIVAAANPEYKETAVSATVLVAASVVVTAIVVPLVTAWWAGRLGPASRNESLPTNPSTPNDEH